VSIVVTLNGKVATKEQLRELPAPIRRTLKRLQRRHRIRATGILVGAANTAVFKAVLNIYTSGSSATETIPDRAGTCVVEAWAPGGGGHAGLGSGCGADNGAGAGSGGYSRSSISVIGQANKTFVFTIGTAGTGGAPNGGNGGQTTVTAGTVTGFPTITVNGGLGGTSTNGGTGGSASGGNQANTTGNTGAAAHATGNGGAGITGTVSGDGSPYGAGGSSPVGSSNNGNPGDNGAVVFSYTA